MNRAERRRRQRGANEYDNRQTFSKKEVEEMNAHAFKIGVAMALYAAQTTLKLGDLRLDRIRKEVLKLEDTFITGGSIEPLPFDVFAMVRYGGRDIEHEIKAARKSAEPSNT